MVNIDRIIFVFLAVVFYVYILNPKLIRWVFQRKLVKGNITEKDIDDYYKKYWWVRK